MNLTDYVFDLFKALAVGISGGVLANAISSKIQRIGFFNRRFSHILLIFILVSLASYISYVYLNRIVINMPLWLVCPIVVLLTIFMILIFRSQGHDKFRIITDGMIGFMRQCIEVESGVDRHRLVICKHIPSYMRSTPLTIATHYIIRRDWNITDRAEDYLMLTNMRSDLIKKIIHSKDVRVREIYEKHVLEKWANTGLLFVGQSPAPREERLERLKELHRLIVQYDANHYDIKIASTSLYFPFMICDGKLIIDVGRQTGRSFSHNIGGLYSDDAITVEQYVQFFEKIWQSLNRPEEQDREKIINWFKKLIDGTHEESR